MSSRSDNTILASCIRADGGQVLSDDFTKGMLEQPKAISTVQLASDQCVKSGTAPTPGEKLGTQSPSFQDGTIAKAIDGSYNIDAFSV